MQSLLRMTMVFSAFMFCSVPTIAEVPSAHKTENVIFVMTDGLRWQEVFGGADEALLNLKNGGVKNVDALKKAYWRDSPEARRQTLMPFLWSVLAKEGQLYGNRNIGSEAHVTNGKNFSYPGYSESLCGFQDSRINSNAKIPNPNSTVLEWLNKKQKFQGKVAAFGSWDVIPSIINSERCGFLVNAGYDPLTAIPPTPAITLLNHIKAETPQYWEEQPFDAIPFYTALEYFKVKKPNILYIMFGETDDWAHEGNYKAYLDAAHRADYYIKTLWETVQSLQKYRNKTTIIFSPDHGRGNAPHGWKDHGVTTEGSGNIWMAFLGPDTPPLGERSNIAPVTQNQIAATLAALLGEDYCADVPKAGRPIADVLPSAAK